MDAASILLVLFAAGVNFGWQPVDGGSDGYEYIVQVEPELLDVLRRGEQVPIESHVPPEVAPIRKVRITVGRGDVPRQAASGVTQTAYFAGENGSPAAMPAGTSAYDRYAVPSSGNPTGVSPPPSVLERTQAAVTETGSTLREGIEAGIQAANEQLSRTGEEVLDATRNAGQEFGQELEEFVRNPGQQMQSTATDVRVATEQTLGALGSGLQQVTNPFANANSPSAANGTSQGGVAPPSSWPSAQSPPARDPRAVGTASRGVAPTRTETGWTSIGTNVAAPPLVVPQLKTPSATSGTDGWPLRTADNSGPSFPSTIDRSGNSPSISRASQDSNLVSVQPLPGSQNSAASADGWADDPWDGADPWAQAPQSSPANMPSQTTSTPGTARQNASASWQFSNVPMQPNNHVPTNQVQTGHPAGPTNAGGGVFGQTQLNGTTAGVASPAAPTFNAEQPPWLPLLVVSLSLVGSLSANLFLGWSYLDARQKYRSLVRKTADTFRRTAAPAAA
jgi:hypothetical protein